MSIMSTCVQAMRVLKEDMWGSVNFDKAPMRVVRFNVFKKFGAIPRSSDSKTVLLSSLDHDDEIVFISHRWFSPWQSEEELRGWLGRLDISQEEKDKVLGWAGIKGADEYTVIG
jgi:hypothetical protein